MSVGHYFPSEQREGATLLAEPRRGIKEKAVLVAATARSERSLQTRLVSDWLLVF